MPQRCEAAVKGKYNGYLLEAWRARALRRRRRHPCQPINKTAGAVKLYSKKAPIKTAPENAYCELIHDLERDADGHRADADVVAESAEALKPAEDAEA